MVTDELTPREREVFELVRAGLTNEEIADRLGISLDGAKYHVSSILSKLGVSTREEAARLAEPVGRRWSWLGVPLAAKLAGAVVLVAAVAGLGVLALGVVSDEGSDASGSLFPTPPPYVHDGAAPLIGEDHWHAGYTVYIGDERQPLIPAFQAGLETPGDGVIHIHPFTA
ncbi:MAG: helix-turn-helix transcriptional regulator [Dehalococcoidia bacterium]